MTLTPCTCGEAHPHEVMRRATADGVHVCLWSDGAVTAALGMKLREVPMRRPRTAEAQHQALKAGRLMLDEVCLYESDELPALYAAAEKAAQGDGLPGTMRAILHAPVYPKLDWIVTHADRNGKPTERFVRLPHLLWPGLAVFDYCGGPGSKRGRYVLVTIRHDDERRDEYAGDTGFAFDTLDALWAHLQTERTSSTPERPS